MKKYVAVFRSRTDVLSFIDDMRTNGQYASAISTPKEAKIGCGISAEITYAGIFTAKKLINKNRYNSFYAIILIDKNSVRRI